jgi:hypothetical protein
MMKFDSTNTPGPMDLIILTLLGVVSACGLSGAMLSFTTSSETGQMNIALLPACLGLTLAGLSSMGLVWFRQRHVPASAWLALGVVAWFVGVNILGWGGFALLDPNSTKTFTEDLGFSLALCFIPGGLLALLGLGVYGYDRRREQQAENTTHTHEGQPTATSAKPIPSQTKKLARAAEYRRVITRMIKQQRAIFADQLGPILTELDEWETHLHQLADRLHRFENDPVIQRDLQEVPAAITHLQTQIDSETNPHLRPEMVETLHGYQKQQTQLEALKTVMRRTELDIDETLAAIGSIYSQLQLLSAKKIDSSKAKHLSADVAEQADHLNDLLEAMDEVYQSSAGS